MSPKVVSQKSKNKDRHFSLTRKTAHRQIIPNKIYNSKYFPFSKYLFMLNIFSSTYIFNFYYFINAIFALFYNKTVCYL